MRGLTRKFSRLIALMPLLLCLSGCIFGPHSLQNSRGGFNSAVQKTSREEMLLNMVRMKYDESEEFLRISSITPQYTYAADVGGTGSWQQGFATKLGGLFGLGAQSRSTFAYMPEQGQDFYTRYHSPISLETLDLMSSGTWSVSRFLRVAVKNMNDIDNASSAGGPTPDLKPDFEQFEYLASQFRALQRYGRRTELAYEDMAVVKPVLRSPSPILKVSAKNILRAAETGHQWIQGEDKKWTLWTRPPVNPTSVLRIAPDAIGSAEMKEVRRILELKPVTNQENFYRIRRDTYGQFKQAHARRVPGKSPDLRKEIVMSMRSVKEMMFYLSHAIEVPKSHRRLVQQTFDSEGRPFDWREMTGDLLCVHVSRFPPWKANVAVPFKGHWFYIKEGDINSKRTFDLLLELFNLEIRAGGVSQGPVLTISS